MIEKSWQLILLVLIVGACQPKVSLTSNTTKLPFYDLAGLVAKIVTDSLYVNVEKSISIDGQEEVKQISDYPLWKDIEEFAYYDLNRPALYDKYQIDTTRKANGIEEITYYPLDEHLKVRLLKIHLKANQVKRITINTTFNSFLENVTLNVDWKLDEGYQIDRSSDKMLGPTTRQVIKVVQHP